MNKPRKNATIPKEPTQQVWLSRALIVQESFNEAEYTVDVVFATSTPVKRYNWVRDEWYNEVLDIDGLDLTRITERGISVLDNHSLWGETKDNVIGRAYDFRKVDGQWMATVKLSDREDLAGMVRDIKRGIIADISCGYYPQLIERVENKETNEIPTYYLRKWQLFEISFVPVPADYNSGTRSADSNDFNPEIFLNPNQRSMFTRQELIELLTARGVAIPDGATDEQLKGLLRTAVNSKPEPPATKPEPGKSEPKTEKQIRAELKAYEQEVRSIAEKAGFDEKTTNKYLDGDYTIEQARGLMFKEWAELSPTNTVRSANQRILVGDDNAAILHRNSTVAGMLLRSNPKAIEKDAFDREIMAAAQGKRNLTLLEILEAEVVRAGGKVDKSISKMEFIKRAIVSNTTDFPVLISDYAHRTMVNSYQIVADTWSQLAMIGSVTDFKDWERLRGGSVPNLKKVGENGEFPKLALSDAEKERIKVETYGGIVDLTRKMIINDDLGGFMDVTNKVGRAAARTIETVFYEMFALNSGNGPTMVDGNPLFHADHGNIHTTGIAIPTVAIIDAMRVQMMEQKDKDGNDFLDLRPAIALSRPNISSTLRLLNTSQYDPDATNKLQKPNVVAGLFEKVVESSRLTGTAWFMLTNPSQNPVFEVAFLNGQQTPTMEQEIGFEVDGISYKVRHDFGVAAIDWRGIVKNTGQP